MQNRTFDQLGSECVQDNDRRCGFVYLLSSVSPISAFSWEVFSDGLAWGMGRKRIVWLRHARMLVCGEVFQGFSDGLSLKEKDDSGGRNRDTPRDVFICNGSRVSLEGSICVIGGVRVN